MNTARINNNLKPNTLGIDKDFNFSSVISIWIQETVVRLLETVQDIIVVLLCFGLFAVMLVKIGELFLSLVPPLKFEVVTSDILFILILVELFRLLITYLQEKRVAVAVAVEASIVSVLREVILRGILEIPNGQVTAICEILLVLGLILVIPAIQIILSNAISSRFRKALSLSESGLLRNRATGNYQIPN